MVGCRLIVNNLLSKICECAGIGRQARLRAVCLMDVWVQVPSLAPILYSSHHITNPTFTVGLFPLFAEVVERQTRCLQAAVSIAREGSNPFLCTNKNSSTMRLQLSSCFFSGDNSENSKMLQ